MTGYTTDLGDALGVGLGLMGLEVDYLELKETHHGRIDVEAEVKVTGAHSALIALSQTATNGVAILHEGGYAWIITGGEREMAGFMNCVTLKMQRAKMPAPVAS